MNRVSLKSGTRRMTHGSSVNSVAAMMGSAAFLLPLISTSPCNGTPPLIKKLSMICYSCSSSFSSFVLEFDYGDENDDEDDLAIKILAS
jgi:hypothetical protein